MQSSSDFSSTIRKILENDLHRAKNSDAVPFMIEVPALPSFVPAVISSTRGEFLVSRKLTDEGRIRVGVFNSQKIDSVIPAMLQRAFALSVDEKWENVFRSVTDAFNYIKHNSCMPAQPHVCMLSDELVGKLGKIDRKYKKYCNVVTADVPFIAFFSKPEQVGLYTRFLSGESAILLHNVRKGISFCTV